MGSKSSKYQQMIYSMTNVVLNYNDTTGIYWTDENIEDTW